MNTPEQKNDKVNTSGGQSSAYPLDSYTVAPKQDSGGDKSPYFKSAAPSIALPKGGGALKGIDEKFSVNAVNGTASLQIPFPMSPGRNGFTPSLSIQYNSGSGNSEFGLGWGMSLPAIQRKTDKRLPRYDDEKFSDVFLLAGAEDLVPEIDATGNPVITITSPYAITRFMPRIEGLFARIEQIRNTSSTGSWWKVTTKENVTTYYGLTAASRVSDPEDDSRIFKWLPALSFDDRGNLQVYNYVTDTAATLPIPHLLHEQNRLNGLAPFTNTYLKSVFYCNVTPFTPSSIYEPSDPGDLGFLMQCYLDYGDHDSISPSVLDMLPVTVRQDPFSDFHAGFEIRTYRKCQRVLLFHTFSEVLSTLDITIPAFLVRSLDVVYLPISLLSPEADYIISVTQTGYKINADGTYLQKSLPAMRFAYEPLTWDASMHTVKQSDSKNLPQGLTGAYEWIDLWGEGVPGILTEQAQGWFYKTNLGNGHFTNGIAVAEKPSFSGLGGAMQWADLDANGKRQLVSKSNDIPGYFELDDDQQWQNFRTFKKWINIDWSSHYTRVLDLNGDGKPDILITEENAWKWYENEGTDGYAEGGYAPVFFDEEKGPRMLHNDMVQAIFLADMNGDGLTDIVRIQNGEVCYWPNIGYGKFGAKVTMSNAPLFDHPDVFDPKYIALADISGTGAPDIIYIAHAKCIAYINLSGNSLANGVEVCQLPAMDPFTKVTVIDFLGNGTACIVWSSPLPQYASSPVRYIDLMGGRKPYLMTSYVNGMGKMTEVTYKQSTKYYIEDKLAGRPWATRLPFPVHCIQQIKTTDSVSNTSYVQQYSYHHGYYDHEEREFRGFGRVETIDTDIAYAFNDALTDGHTDASDLNQYPVKTKSWYNTGAWMRERTLLDAFADEYFPLSSVSLPVNPDLPQGLNAQEQREAYRAMKGQALRQEVYALDGSADQDKPYNVTTNAYAVKLVQQASTISRFASFLSYGQQSLTFSCERNIADPRIMHELVLETDELGNVLKSAQVCYPRAASFATGITELDGIQQTLLCTYTENKFTNDISTTSDYRLRVHYSSEAFEITGLPYTGSLFTVAGIRHNINGLYAGGSWVIPAAAIIDYTTAPTATGTIPVEQRRISAARTLFAANDTTTVLALGTIDSLAIPYQQYHLAITADMLTHANWYNSLITADSMLTTDGGYIHEADIAEFGSALAHLWLPGGTVSYIDASTAAISNFFMPAAFSDPWGNIMTITYWDDAAINYFLFPKTVTDPNGNITMVRGYNFYNLQPDSIEDSNSNIGDVLFDVLGMTVAVAMRGKGTGIEGDELGALTPDTGADIIAQTDFWGDPEAHAADLLGSATWRCIYNLETSPVAVAMIGREIHYHEVGGATSPLLVRLTYTDGLGRIAMNKVQAAPEVGDTTIRWVGNGKTIYNNKGTAVMQYEPYFSTSPLYDDAEAAAAIGVSPRIHYDALGRATRTDMPDGSYAKEIWDAWKHEVWDGNDTIADSIWLAERQTGSLITVAPEVDASVKTIPHEDTFTTIYLDTLARPVYTRQINAYINSVPVLVTENLDSYVELDIAGGRKAVHDARGITTLNYYYNTLKASVRQLSTDSGTSVMLTDVAGQPLYAWDAAGNLFTNFYDNLRRPLQKEVMVLSTSVTKILEYTEYGDMISGAATNNLVGKVYRHYDGAGVQQMNTYDFKGNPINTDRTFTFDYKQHPDWTVHNRTSTAYLETTVYTTVITCDALGRPVTLITPDGATTRHTYDRNGLLYSVNVDGVHSLTTGIVRSITYNAKGQRLRVQMQNDAATPSIIITTTTYEYDDKTFRVRRIRTTRLTIGAPGDDVLQDLKYYYDPVGNITMLRDFAQQDIYYNGTVASPDNSYTYDSLYRLIKAIGREHAGGNVPFNCDDSHRIGFGGFPASMADTNAMRPYTQRYIYDEAGNMIQMGHTTTGTGSWTRGWTISTGSNRTTDHVMGSRVTTTGETPVYDIRGNLVRGLNHLYDAGGTADSMVYNEQNRLEKVLITATRTAYYQYDSAGQRVRKVTEDSATNTGKRRKYVGQWEVYEEYNISTSSVSLIRETLNIMDDAARVALIDTEIDPSDDSVTSQNTRYQYSNHLGTASLELDYNAAIISYEEYYPYGNTSFQNGRTSAEVRLKRYRYTGKERDEETGFYYHGARYYCPWLCRWMAVDPLENKFAPESSYNYGHNNPITFTDSTGMAPEDQPGLTRVIKVEDQTGKPMNLPEGTHIPYKPNGPHLDWDPFTGKNEIVTGKQVLSEPTGEAAMIIETITYRQGFGVNEGMLTLVGKKDSIESTETPADKEQVPTQSQSQTHGSEGVEITTPKEITPVDHHVHLKIKGEPLKPLNLPITFMANSDRFVNKAAVEQTVGNLANKLKANPKSQVTLIGNSSMLIFFNTKIAQSPELQAGAMAKYGRTVLQPIDIMKDTASYSIKGKDVLGPVATLMTARAQAVSDMLTNKFGINAKRIKVQVGKVDNIQTTQYILR